MVSAGWDAEAVANVRPVLNRLVGRLAYVASALEVLLLRPPAPLVLVLPDGGCHAGFGVVVSNCRYYGGRYMVTPGASMFSETLEVCLLRQGGRLAMLKFATGLFRKRPLKSPLVEFFTLTSAELRGEKVSVQVDGDAWGRLPVHCEVIPRAVTLILPDIIQEKFHGA
jgi:diacylglycerol kinase family enzyme